MEMNTKYSVNIISLIDADRGLFVAVEKFSHNSTKSFINYYKELIGFRDCGNSDQASDCPIFETGKTVIVQGNKKNSPWLRGIITKCYHDDFHPEMYLIDFQRFTEKDGRFRLRNCPPKFLQLKLPSYYIDIDFCLDNADLKTAMLMLINKSQHGEFGFNFIPQSVKNNVYTGVLSVESKINCVNIPIKQILQNIHNNFFSEDFFQFKSRYFSIFNPIEFPYLKNIFMPREQSDTLFLDSDLVSSYCNLSIHTDSNINPSYNFPDKFSSSSNNSKNIGFIDYSESEYRKLQDTYITPMAKQKMTSTNSSPVCMSNSSLQSVNSYSSNCTVKDTGCQQNNNSTLTLKISETPKIHLVSVNKKPVQSNNTTIENLDVLWSDDDDLIHYKK